MNALQNSIEKVTKGKNLTQEEAAAAFQVIMEGEAMPTQIAALLTGLHTKGESVEELTGAAMALRKKSLTIKAPANTIDTCGTGGDASGTLNISTAVALTTAACGVAVAKHGNKAVSSRSGSADVLTALGVNINARPAIMEQALEKAGICFLLAPLYHSAMKHVAPVRKELGIRTIFNLLGPLLNPAKSHYHLLGVYARRWVEPLAHTLHHLGSERAWVVHGEDGLDEISTTAPTFVAELNKGKVSTFTINPEEYGIKLATLRDIKGGDATENAKAITELLDGKKGAYYDIVVLNTAAALTIAGKVPDIGKGIPTAKAAIDSGKAKEVLAALVRITN